MVEPKNIMKNIMNYLGSWAVIGGGSVRDVVLNRTPKDYDIFFLEFRHFREIVEQRGIWDKDPTEIRVRSGPYLGTEYVVFNTTLQGEAVQLIWQDRSRPSYFSSFKSKISGEDVIDRFDFTINMMFYDFHHDIFISPEARYALNRREVIFNHNHQSAFLSRVAILNYMTKRMLYLAEKLNYIIPLSTAKALFERYIGGGFPPDTNLVDEPLDCLRWS